MKMTKTITPLEIREKFRENTRHETKRLMHRDGSFKIAYGDTELGEVGPPEKIVLNVKAARMMINGHGMKALFGAIEGWMEANGHDVTYIQERNDLFFLTDGCGIEVLGMRYSLIDTLVLCDGDGETDMFGLICKQNVFFATRRGGFGWQLRDRGSSDVDNILPFKENKRKIESLLCRNHEKGEFDLLRCSKASEEIGILDYDENSLCLFMDVARKHDDNRHTALGILSGWLTGMGHGLQHIGYGQSSITLYGGEHQIPYDMHPVMDIAYKDINHLYLIKPTAGPVYMIGHVNGVRQFVMSHKVSTGWKIESPNLQIGTMATK